MHRETRMLTEPSLHFGMFVGGVVVGDQMQSFLLGRLALDLAQELQPLDVPMAGLALGDDLAVQNMSVANNVVVPLRL